MHAAAFGQGVLEPAVRAGCRRTAGQQTALTDWTCCKVTLTDAVVPQVAGQALPLVLWVVVPLPHLELLTGQILVLRLPLRADVRGQRSQSFRDTMKLCKPSIIKMNL